ncbi:hypothetical protein MG293_008174 [Ovis ammon polii]|uniref:Uncharacterized protein n=1 Tax=Ovis ammon polii TaxID=230172 RepID=A0AAD4YBA7_OVIAM|nr:hypothetical protein MG293_008174 [Ovis ammon polii]
MDSIKRVTPRLEEISIASRFEEISFSTGKSSENQNKMQNEKKYNWADSARWHSRLKFATTTATCSFFQHPTLPPPPANTNRDISRNFNKEATLFGLTSALTGKSSMPSHKVMKTITTKA